MNNKELFEQWKKSFGNEDKLIKKYGGLTEPVLEYAKILSNLPFAVNPQVFENLRKVKIAYIANDKRMGRHSELFESDMEGFVPSPNGLESTLSVKVSVSSDFEKKYGDKLLIDEYDNTKLTLFHELNHATCYKEYMVTGENIEDTKMKVLNLHPLTDYSEGFTPMELKQANILQNNMIEQRISDMPIYTKRFDKNGNMVRGTGRINLDNNDLNEGITELNAIRMFLMSNKKYAENPNSFIENNAQYLPFVRLAQVYDILYDNALTKSYYKEADETQKVMLEDIHKNFEKYEEQYVKMLDAFCKKYATDEQLLESVNTFKDFMKSWQKDIINMAKSPTMEIDNNQLEELAELTTLLTTMKTYRNTFKDQMIKSIDNDRIQSILKESDNLDKEQNNFVKNMNN